jgi:hypothetical protein
MTLPLPHSSVIKVVYIPSTSRYGGCSTYTHLSTPKSIHPMPRQNFFFLFFFSFSTPELPTPRPDPGRPVRIQSFWPANERIPASRPDPADPAGERTDPGHPGRLALQIPRCRCRPFRSRRLELHSPAGKREEEPERERLLKTTQKKKKEKSEVEMPGQGVKSGCDTLGVSIAFSSRERDKWVENFQTWPTPQFPFFFFF